MILDDIERRCAEVPIGEGKIGWNTVEFSGRLDNGLRLDQLLPAFAPLHVANGRDGYSSVKQLQNKSNTYLVQSHPILNKESNTRVKVTNVSFQNEVLFRLGRDLSLEIAKTLLSYVSKTIL